MAKYKVGDVVKVREDLIEYKAYGYGSTCVIFVPLMSVWLGKYVTIKSYNDKFGSYEIVEDHWSFTEDMFECLVKVEMKKGKIKENTMKQFNIVDYKVYNNKVVIVKFEDGTEEKATCMDGDNFDLETGVGVCVFKHLMGSSEYAKTIRTAMKQINAVDKAKEEKKQLDEMIAKKRENARRKKDKTRENRRQRRIADMKEAYLAAMIEFGDMMYGCENDIEFADEDFYDESVNCETCEHRDSCDDWK